VASCHDCSDGGLGAALAEVAFAGGLGMEADLRRVPAEGVDRDDFLLFSESQSRFVVTVHPENQKPFEDALQGNAFAQAGRVSAGHEFKVAGLQGTVVIRAHIDELKEAWKKPLQW
jgi:phosphoribosylformylglycinamidine synthase